MALRLVKSKKSSQTNRRFVSCQRKGEDLYIATGQTNAGRYLFVAFIFKVTKEALILSARDMTVAERESHDKK